jgi:hypothetical protein
MIVIVLARHRDYSVSAGLLANDLCVGVTALVVASTCWRLFVELQDSKVALGEHVQNWLDYLRNREAYDARLLAGYGIDLNDESVRKMYGA